MMKKIVIIALMTLPLQGCVTLAGVAGVAGAMPWILEGLSEVSDTFNDEFDIPRK